MKKKFPPSSIPPKFYPEGISDVEILFKRKILGFKKLCLKNY